MAHPYRTSPLAPELPPRELDDDLAGVVTFSVCWLSSVLRFALAVGHDEPFGFQMALALAITLITPLAVERTWRRERGRR